MDGITIFDAAIGKAWVDAGCAAPGQEEVPEPFDPSYGIPAVPGFTEMGMGVRYIKIDDPFYFFALVAGIGERDFRRKLGDSAGHAKPVAAIVVGPVCRKAMQSFFQVGPRPKVELFRIDKAAEVGRRGAVDQCVEFNFALVVRSIVCMVFVWISSAEIYTKKIGRTIFA